MKRSSRVKWSELRVGMILLFGFALLVWAAFTGTGFSVFMKTEPLVAYFAEVGGLLSGSPVWMAGMEVGHVERVEFVQRDGHPAVRVDFRVRRKVFRIITSQARVAVGTMGLMGDKFLDIHLGAGGGSPIAPGVVLATVSSADLTTAFSGAPELMKQINGALAELTLILQRINRGEGFLGQLTYDSGSSTALDSLIKSTGRLVDNLDRSQKLLIESVRETSAKLNALADAAVAGEGSLARLVNDTSLYGNLTAMTSRMNNVFARLEAGEGTAGRLLGEDQVYNDVRLILADLQALITDIKENPKRYFKVSLF